MRGRTVDEGKIPASRKYIAVESVLKNRELDKSLQLSTLKSSFNELETFLGFIFDKLYVI